MVSSMVQNQEWVACSHPEMNDTLRWKEPIWASPNKARGKPDKIGEQEIVAQLIGVADVLKFTVISVKKLEGGEASLNVKENDVIRRKKSTLQQGDCYKLIDE